MVPDELTVRIFRRHLHILEMQEMLIPEQHTLILDGLPRSYAQAEMLDSVLDVVQIFHLRSRTRSWRWSGSRSGPSARTGSTT